MIVVVFYSISPVYSAGFDCTKAASKIEKMICSDPQLDKLDSDLLSSYKLAKDNLSKQQFEEIKNEQRKWIKFRNQECTTIELCINAYQHRVDILGIYGQWKNFDNKITPLSLYHRFNLRTIFSSYGQRVKYYCETYPFEYFSSEQMKVEDNTLILDNGDDYLTLTIQDDGQIGISNQISQGTYNTSENYVVNIGQEQDIRASETYIDKSPDCESYSQLYGKNQSFEE